MSGRLRRIRCATADVSLALRLRRAVVLAAASRIVRRGSSSSSSASSVKVRMRRLVLLRKALTLAVAQQVKPEPNHRVQVRAARDGVNAEFHASVVEPLPHLPVHLADLHVSLERPIVPAQTRARLFPSSRVCS